MPPMAVYALTIFTGAFLLFQVQPLIGKYILPWFGGGPGVWTTCMLFFQVLLLGGYAYAHFSSRWLKPRTQAVVHLILLAAALALLPITPGDAWKPHGGGNPTLQILALLAVSLGLPYFVLSATGPLIQQWFSRAKPGVSPYRLYALSNLGSLLALVSYPFFFETHFTRKLQAGMWGWGLVAYVLCCGFCAVRLWKSEVPSLKSEVQSQEPEVGHHGPSSTPAAAINYQLSTINQVLWLLLPACASVLLLATTNKLCQDVAVIPFLWVLPLALYLLSFIICFDSPRWYVRYPFTLALIAALGCLCWALFDATDWPLVSQVVVYCGGLFICCMVCHGELYRLKPDPRQLTGYYLMIAAGGALGGLFVAIAAPLVFTDYYELHWGLFLCGLLFLFVCLTARAESRTWNEWVWLGCTLGLLVFGGLDWSMSWLGHHTKAVPWGGFVAFRVVMWTGLVLVVASWIVRKKFRNFQHWRVMSCAWLSLGMIALGATLWAHVHNSGKDRVYRSRNFYGVLTVYEHEKDDPLSHYFLLQHGRITHGLQFADAEQATWPISYYGPDSGIGLGVGALQSGHRRIGVVGLGTGTMAAFVRAGDYLRFYEINPEVQAVANSWFSYLPKCPGNVEVARGDARLSMENEPPQHFDLLVLDAFSSDAIPVHLLTKEAFEVYERHLNTNGVIAVHISNHYLNLQPVVVNLARHFGYKLASIDFVENDEEWWYYASTWILLTRNEKIINSPDIRHVASKVKANSVNVPLWTDDFASLFQILR
ncbi:MAG: fused MFS/spermidine synthase [Verrucomicrobia bacterium]|nr:fused MFS/spermidine synthase [Verrucomicrobiota bacterium]